MNDGYNDWQRPPLAQQAGAGVRQLFLRRWQIREWIVLALMFAVPEMMMFFELPVGLVGVGFFFAMVGALCLLLLRGDWQFFGPQFYYDVICLARRGRSNYVRILYVSALLIGQGCVHNSYFHRREPELGMMFIESPEVRRNQMVEFAGRFVNIVIIMQNLAVVLLTPIYAASAITEERERGTLEMMFTSHLSDREIVLGKLGGRLLHIGGVLLAGLPVLSLSQFLGGVDMMVLLANFALTAMNLVTVGSVCIMVSVYSRKALTAVLMSYVVLFPLVLGFGYASLGIMQSQQSFGTAPGEGARQLEQLIILALVHCVISISCVTVAVSGLRSMREADFGQAKQALFGEPETFHEAQIDPRNELAADEKIVLRKPVRSLPPIVGDPLLWKEMHQGSKSFVFSPIFWVPVGSLMIPLVLMFVAAFLAKGRGVNGDGEGLGTFGFLKFLLLMLTSQFCMGVAYRTSASVVGERQRGTLDALLTLPPDPTEILEAKWQGGLAKGWGWSLFFVPMLLLGLLGGGIPPLAAVFFTANVLLFGAFLASLGIWLSVVSPTVLAAQTRMGLFLLLLLALYIVGNFVGDFGWIGSFNSVLNPLKSWEFLMDPREDFERRAAVFINLVWLAGSAFVMWRFACWRFKAV